MIVIGATWIPTPGIGELPDRWCLMVTYYRRGFGPAAAVTVLLCSDSVGI